MEIVGGEVEFKALFSKPRENQMTEQESRKLKVGDRVKFCDAFKPGHPGTVTDVGYYAVKVAYDDGIIGVTDHRDNGLLELIEEAK